MVPFGRFEIFRKVSDREPIWVETCESIESAKARVCELALMQPDCYLIFDRQGLMFLDGCFGRPNRDSRTVLVADDDEETRTTVCQTLRGHNYIEIVGEARNGKEAIAKARESRPDLIVMDWRMPELDGVTAGQVIKTFSPETAILIFSVESGRVLDQFVKSLGLEGFASKGTEELLPAVDAILQQRA